MIRAPAAEPRVPGTQEEPTAMHAEPSATASGAAGTTFPAQARVVVIGGGIVGASVAFHLTERGWNDVVLLERRGNIALLTLNRPAAMNALSRALRAGVAPLVDRQATAPELPGFGVVQMTVTTNVPASPRRFASRATSLRSAQIATLAVGGCVGPITSARSTTVTP